LAGPKSCTFHAPSPAKVESRLQSLLKSVKKNPVVVPASSSSGRPEVVSYSAVRRMIASVLYRPLVLFPRLADALSELEQGNGQPFIKLSGQGSGDPFICESDPGPTPELPEAEGNEDASKAILCSDAIHNRTVDEFAGYVGELMNVSKSAGATMSAMILGCVGWSVRAKWRFTGKSHSVQCRHRFYLTVFSGPFEGNTSFPILFVANTADNFTPLVSAQRNAKGFPGSVILIQDSYGVRSTGIRAF